LRTIDGAEDDEIGEPCRQDHLHPEECGGVVRLEGREPAADKAPAWSNSAVPMKLKAGIAVAPGTGVAPPP